MLEPASIRLVIASKLENVGLVGVAVKSICAHLQFDETEAGQVELCIVEAITNSIVHAHRGAPHREVTLLVCVHEDRLEFQIIDHGPGIPPDKLCNPRLEYDPRDVRTLPQGGMGIYLVHQIMDAVSYERGVETNTLTLVKNLQRDLA